VTDYSIGGSSGTTGLSPWASPTPAGKIAAVDPADTTTNPHGSAGADKWLTIGQLLGVGTYLFPSGDSSGAADVTAINNVIANGGTVKLLQAPLSTTPYYVSSPLLPASGSGIKGAQPWASSQNDTYGPAGSGFSGGTTIYAVSGFSGAGIINMTNATGTQYSGVSLEDFCIEGFSTGGSGCHGILVNGAWGAGFITGVTVHRPDQDCLRFVANATSGDEPDEWTVRNTKLSAARNGNGVWADNLPDSVFTDVNSSENNLDGWLLNWSTNTRLTACKSENNGSAGFHLTGMGYPDAALALTGCTTHLNNFDGFFFDNPNSNPNGQYHLTGCFAIDDGQAGGTTYAGFRSSGSPARIMGSNCFAYGAYYGAAQAGSAAGSMTFTSSYLAGSGAATHDDGSNAVPLANRLPAGQQLQVTLGSTFNSGTGTSAQNVTGMAVALPVGTCRLRARLWYTAHGTTGSTQTFAWTFGGTASSVQAAWQFKTSSYTAPAAGTSLTVSSGLSPVLTTTTYPLDFEAYAVVTAAGTLQLTVQSGTSGDEVSVLAGSCLDVTPATA
jgi:hypothetical protein